MKAKELHARFKEQGDPIGEGGFAEVHKVVYTENHRQIALARKRIRPSRQGTIEKLLQEANIMKPLDHGHVLRLVGTYSLRRNELYLLLWPVATCNLKEFLRDVHSLRTGAGDREDIKERLRMLELTDLRTIEEKTYGIQEIQHRRQCPVRFAMQIIGCIARALAYLHKSNIRHLDLKPENILLSSGTVYLADFGISKDVSEMDNTALDTWQGTYRWWAPEMFDTSCSPPSMKKADVYSLGLVLLNIATFLYGMDPSTFEAATADILPPKRIEKIQKFQDDLRKHTLETQHFRDEADATISPKHIIGLTSQMLSPDPESRPSAEKVDNRLVKRGGIDQIYHAPCCKKPSAMLTKRINKVYAAHAALEKEVKTLKSVNETWEARIKNEREKHAKEIQKLKEQLEAEKKQREAAEARLNGGEQVDNRRQGWHRRQRSTGLGGGHPGRDNADIQSSVDGDDASQQGQQGQQGGRRQGRQQNRNQRGPQAQQPQQSLQKRQAQQQQQAQQQTQQKRQAQQQAPQQYSQQQPQLQQPRPQQPRPQQRPGPPPIAPRSIIHTENAAAPPQQQPTPSPSPSPSPSPNGAEQGALRRSRGSTSRLPLAVKTPTRSGTPVQHSPTPVSVAQSRRVSVRNTPTPPAAASTLSPPPADDPPTAIFTGAVREPAAASQAVAPPRSPGTAANAPQPKEAVAMAARRNQPATAAAPPPRPQPSAEPPAAASTPVAPWANGNYKQTHRPQLQWADSSTSTLESSTPLEGSTFSLASRATTATQATEMSESQSQQAPSTPSLATASAATSQAVSPVMQQSSPVVKVNGRPPLVAVPTLVQRRESAASRDLAEAASDGKTITSLHATLAAVADTAVVQAPAPQPASSEGADSVGPLSASQAPAAPPRKPPTLSSQRSWAAVAGTQPAADGSPLQMGHGPFAMGSPQRRRGASVPKT